MAAKLYVRQDVGSGKPIVLLHGMFADGSQWDTITGLLSQTFRVIVVDLLGHGQSPRPKNAQYTDKEHVVALQKTLGSLKATKDVTMVGYSMGGSVALAYSSTYPQSVVQLYLISTPFYLEPSEMIPHRYAGSILITKFSTWLYRQVERTMQSGRPGQKLVEFSNASTMFHRMIGAHDNILDAEIVRLNLQHLVREFDFVGHLQKLQGPLTFYTGKKDVFVVQTQLDALRQYQPYMDIQQLDIIKIDHMLVQNLPKKIAALLQKNARDTLHVGTDTGSGKVLVMLHGIESSSDYWRALIKPLAEHRRIVTVDLLGFGKSPKPLNLPYTLDNQVEWLKRTLDQLGIREFEFCAHSLGSIVALAFAAKHPERVQRLTLLAPVFVPSKQTSKNLIIKRLHFTDKISDGSYLYTHTSQALGYKRLSRYLPFLRSVQNTIRNQHATSLAHAARNIPTTILYGKYDKLIDEAYLQHISRQFTHATVTKLPRVGHNFTLFTPSVVLEALDGEKPHRQRPGKTLPIPPSFIKQLVLLALPILLAKSALHLGAGLLLFTDSAAWVITLGLAAYVILLGYSYIRGAFSLRNESLSYLGYVFLGLFGVGVGYLLLQRPELALRVSTLAICGLVLAAGLARLLVAVVWRPPNAMRRSLLISGSLMTLAGALALGGGILSIQLIVYTVAIILLIRGVQFGCYALVAVSFAYIRGFMK